MDSKRDHNEVVMRSADLDKERARRKAAEAKLEALEGLYRRLYDNASDGIVLFDDRGIIINANPTFLKMLGYRLEEIKGQEAVALIHPEDLEKVPSQLHRLLAGQSVTIERRLRCKGGHYICGEQSSRRVGHNVTMALYRDITARKKVEQESREALQDAEASESQLEEAISRVNTMALDAEVAALEMSQIFNATSDGICVINKDFQISKYNRILQDMMAGMGLAMTEETCSDVFGHAFCKTKRCLMNRILKDGLDRIEEEIEMTSADGGKRTLIVTAQPLLDLTADTIGIVASYTDITDRKQIEEELRRLATTDPLTGAYNRRQFMERAQEEIDRSKRYNTPLTLLMIDIDHFKTVNDTFGHNAGDAVLKRMVSESMIQLRGSDIFCRLGGEEFAAILTHTAPEQGILAAERLRKALKALTVTTTTGPVRFTVSIGVASLVQADLTLEQVMKKADDALYDAKDQGRDRVVAAD
ncbi:MAG: diguanylate cyclase [Desulfobacteraceae bacterium]|nr:diguanylate cyclase [Desulfobacteraceae bacterium]MBC2752986.1 diguanylate cyclase [Desulfobacteraceae bacterium]